MQLELSLSFCLQWGKYFMFVLGKHQILILARNTFQNKPPGIQPLCEVEGLEWRLGGWQASLTGSTQAALSWSRDSTYGVAEPCLLSLPLLWLVDNN